MARTDIERYDQTYKYLQSINHGLAQHVDQLVSTMDKSQLGGMLSLKGIWSKGHLYRGQHDALRALLLCQAIYLKKPWARKRVQDSKLAEDGKSRVVTGHHYDEFPLAWQTDVPSSVVRNMSESDIDKRIEAYWPLGTASRRKLAEVARCGDGVVKASIDYRDYGRESPCYFLSSICYDAVKQFLFKSGYLSIRWLTHQGPSLESHTANSMLGYGRKVSADVLKTVGEGFIFNFHGGDAGGRKNEDVCHWGVTLGKGLAAGTNTTKAAGNKSVTCIQGSLDPGCWGVFNLTESYQVCEAKYRGDKNCDTVIRIIDPEEIQDLY